MKFLFIGLILSFTAFAHPYLPQKDKSFTCSQKNCGYAQKVSFQRGFSDADKDRVLEALGQANTRLIKHFVLSPQLLLRITDQTDKVAFTYIQDGSILLNTKVVSAELKYFLPVFLHEYGHNIFYANFLWPVMEHGRNPAVSHEILEALKTIVNISHTFSETFADMQATIMTNQGNLFPAVDYFYDWNSLPFGARDVFGCRDYSKPVVLSEWDIAQSPVYGNNHVYFCATGGLFWRNQIKNSTDPVAKLKLFLKAIADYSNLAFKGHVYPEDPRLGNVEFQQILSRLF